MSSSNNNKENDNPKAASEQCVTLRNGVQMPLIGLGTSHSGGYSHSSVVYALAECGYRLVDTAKRYGTEAFLREALLAEGVPPRERLFITSKLWPTDYGSSSTVKAALRGSLDRLGLHHLDAFLIHYPAVSRRLEEQKWPLLAETWRALELAYDEGLVRAIGVSNYSVEDLEKQLEHGGETASMRPLLNQIEFHPYQQPTELLDYCAENGIQVQGYCPLGSGNLVGEPVVAEVADAVGRSPAQVLLRWSLQRGVPTIPKSTKRERVRENAAVFDFELSDGQMTVLNGLKAQVGGGGGRKFVELDIAGKIDENLPDGYKLDARLKENLLAS